MKIFGVVLGLVGLVWIFQGAGILGGSFMTGQSLWLYIGLAAAAGGVAMFVWGLRRGPGG